MIRWEDQKDGLSSWGYSGITIIGRVVTRDDGTVSWQIDGVSMRWVAKGVGQTDTLCKGKRSLERAWKKWLDQTGLTPSGT